MTNGAENSEASAPFELPITGELDLHTFRPREIGELVPDYLRQCQARGILEVRIVHGKGTGQLLRSVHALLSRLPEVVSYQCAAPAFGGAGATWAYLRPLVLVSPSGDSLRAPVS